MLVNRTFDPVMMRRWKPGEMEMYLQQVRQKDPTFDMAAYPTQAAAKKQFTSGTYSQAKNSVNMLIGHVNTLNDAYSKLNNSDFPAWNAVGNFAGEQFGDQRLQGALGSFNTAADAVASEAAKAFKGTGATAEKEIEEWRRNVSANMPPAKFKASVDTLFQLLGSRLSSLDDTYKSAVGRPRDFQLLSPKSRAILQHRLGKNPDDLEGGGAATTPQAPPAAASGGKQLDDATARQFLTQAGGDKNKARELARAAGYTF